MKIWVDDIRKPPDNSYIHCRSVNETIQLIKDALKNNRDIEIIDLDHDSGDFYSDGGDYIEVLSWLEYFNLSYPIRIHSMNPVGRGNMRRIIYNNHWVEIN